ncbi:MAG: FAD-dependent oxidoreductase [Clostridia bacterium]|nr:FAD-dependent oxidoreductase [Clostridia bacterium]
MKLTVIGGGLKGCAAARAAKKLGFDVTILESRQTLGHEITAAGQEWLKSGKSEITVQTGAVGKSLLSQQLDMGNNVLLNAQAGGILASKNTAAGVLAATPFGTHLLKSDLVIDTQGLLFADIKEQIAEYRYNLTVVNMNHPVFLPEIEVPASFGLTDNKVRIHLSVRPDSIVIELRFAKHVNKTAVVNPQRELPVLQRISFDVFEHLTQTHPAFKDAKLHNMCHNELTLHNVKQQQTIDLCGYHVLETQLPDPLGVTALYDMYDDIASEIARISEGISPSADADRIITANGDIDLSLCKTFKDPAVEFRNGLTLTSVQLPANLIPIRENVPVMVAGGGTSGIQTLEALADSGITAALADICAMPGGTRTLGMVMGYWHGHKKGRNETFDAESAKLGRKYHIGENGSELYLNNLLTKANENHYYFNTLVCGCDKSGKKVNSLILCDMGGLFRIEADVFVDATGDGVAAYLAGAAYELGDKRDGNVQTYSTWGENLWKMTNFMENRFHGDNDMIDMDSYEDQLRGMYLGQHDNSDIRYSPLLTVRESRRIIGDHVQKLDEIWDEKVFDDTICVTLTPFDQHGKGSSIYDDMELAKSVGKEQRARIPYRSYIVRDLENMLITAKAYSATRDANTIGRMNADLRHAGYAVGLAAAQAIKQHKSIRDIDLTPVQDELKAQGILPDWTFVEPTKNTVSELIELCEANDIEAMLKLYRTTDSGTIKALESYYMSHKDSDTALSLAAWHDFPGAAEAAYQRLLSILYASKANEDEKITEYVSALRLFAPLIRNSKLDHDQLKAIIDLSCSGGRCYYAKDHGYYGKIYGYERIDGWKAPHFKFLYLLSQAVERNPHESLVEPMENLLRKEYIGGFATINNEAPDSPLIGHSMSPIFCALLELRLAASAARCTSALGFDLLKKYSNEDRSILRKFAKKELIAIGDLSAVSPYTGDLTFE